MNVLSLGGRCYQKDLHILINFVLDAEKRCVIKYECDSNL